MSKQKTTEQFIKDACVVHGDKYDYSESIYVGCKIKITVICPIHDKFTIRPNDHLSSQQGCYDCGRIIKTVTTAEFIANAHRVHGEYDYSRSVYVGAQTPLTITCKLHGDFKQKTK